MRISKLSKRNDNVFCFLLWTWTFFMGAYLVYQQILSSGLTYASDYVPHINLALCGKGYSLFSLIISSFFRVAGERIAIARYLIAIFMGMVIASTGVALRYALRMLLEFEGEFEYETKSECVLTLVSYGLIFLCTFKIPGITAFYIMSDDAGRACYRGPYFLGTIITQPWHNPTYLCMRPFAIMTFAIFVGILNETGKVSVKRYSCFLFLLTLCNACKPNFVVVFAPAACIICVVSCIKNHGKNFMRYLILAILFIASLCVLLPEYLILFPRGSGAGTVFTIERFMYYLDSGYLLWILVASFCFPVIVTVASYRYKRRNKAIIYGWLLELIGFMEMMFLTETGERRADGNYYWGVYATSIILFLVCVSELIYLYKSQKKSKLLEVALVFFIVHMVEGLMYFGIVFFGYSALG